MRYLPHTPAEIEQMLATIGAADLDALFDSIPEAARLKEPLKLPSALDEARLMKQLGLLASSNEASAMTRFLGAGAYQHHIPPVVGQLLLRSEFYTAYTPYQPEVAQGTLQAIFEFQTLVSELLGLPLANASLYDGASALAEGAQMARRLTKRNRILIGTSVHPAYAQVVRTYLEGDALAEVVLVDDVRDLGAFDGALDASVAACLVGYPTFRGTLRPLSTLCDNAHATGALVVSSTTEPYALGVAQAPGDQGVDIATGEGQALASTTNFGGPYLGLFACRNERKYLQQLPGRVCGRTVDEAGAPGFVLTLSTREQHIRRERATSNICTNQGLIALAFTIRLSLLGQVGFKQTASACLSKAEYLKAAIARLPHCAIVDEDATFNEFVWAHDRLSGREVVERLAKRHVLAGLDRAELSLHTQLDGAGLRANAYLGEREVLCAVTELHERQQLDALVTELAALA